MSETYEKVDKDTLKVTRNDTNIHTFYEGRTEIQTKIDHLKFDKDKMEMDFGNEIEVLEAKLAILDEGE